MGNPQATVLVLGAGMSGLAAAYELMRAGFDVKVFEGRDVPGGRVQTIREGFSPGHYAEAGAMFLIGSSSLTLRYAKTFNVALEGSADCGPPKLYYLSGQRIVDPPARASPAITWPYSLTELEQQLGLSGIEKVYCPTGQTAPSWPEEWPAETAVLDQISYATRMQGLGASPAAIKLLAAGNLSMYGDGPGTYSALMMMYDRWFTNTHRGGFQAVGGNDRFPSLMAAALGDRINYRSHVSAIASTDTKVRVTVDTRSGQQIVEGDYVVCALPFKVLDGLPVSPPLSLARKEALHQTPCTSAVRVCLEFKRPFWDVDGLKGLVITDLPIQITYPQPHQPGPQAVLNQLIIGENARAMATLSEPDRLLYTLSEMAKFFPEAPSEFVGGVSKVWDTDPWAKGAYAYYAPGQMTKYLPVFQKPEGRVYFAGDYMSLLPGWIEGALKSGIGAATAIAGVSGGQSIEMPPDFNPAVDVN